MPISELAKTAIVGIGITITILAASMIFGMYHFVDRLMSRYPNHQIEIIAIFTLSVTSLVFGCMMMSVRSERSNQALVNVTSVTGAIILAECLWTLAGG